MPPVRERMRPWLVKQINSKAVSGLNWLDKEKTTFSIPWKHAARHGWEIEKDACLFQMWAVHTGKYGLGQESNPKTWKANFRCALNSLPDVVEVKDRSIQKGHEAMRVFRMLPVAQKSKDRRKKGGKTKSKRKIKIEEEDPDYEDSTKSPLEQSPQPEPSPTQESTVDSTVHTEQQDFTYMSLSEVPECSLTVEVGTENGYKFEVSPEHSPDSSNYDDNNNNFTITIYQPVGKETHWSSLDGKGFLSNEPCTSPGSQWSEASSADDVDEPMYITLNTSFPSTTSDLWSSFELPKTLLEL